MAVETRVNMQLYSNQPPPSRVSTKPCKRVVVNENGKMGLNPNRLRLTTSLEVSRSNRLRLSLPRRMLARLRARERFGFRRISTIHCFPAQKSSCLSWIRSRSPLRGSPGFAPGSLLFL
jgi:hypothetical protein